MNTALHLLSTEIVWRLGWTLLHFLWEGAAIAAITWLVLATLRNKSASARYIVACIGLLMMLATAATTSTVISPPPQTSTAMIENNPMPPIRTATVRERSTPTANPPLSNMPAYETNAYPTIVQEHIPNANSVSWQQRVTRRCEPYLPWVVTAWLIGSLALSLRLFGGWIQVQRLRHRWVEPVEKKCEAMLAELREMLRITQPVQLLTSQIAHVPMAMGWLRPVILLPITAVTGLNTDQLRALLAHELAHIRRHDYVFNILQSVIEVLLFYHPAVWWLSRRIRTEREHCCDDIAVACCGDSLLYARTLAAMEELRGAPHLAAAATGGQLTSRIRRLFNRTRTHDRIPNSLTTGILTLSMLGVFAAGILSTHTLAEADNKSAVEEPVNIYVQNLPADQKKNTSTQPTATRPAGAKVPFKVDTRPAATKSETIPHVYDIEDLLMQFPRSDLGSSSDETNQEDRKKNIEILQDLIRKFIEPGTWGDGRIGYLQIWNDRLILRHTRLVHQQLAEVFAELRESKDSPLPFEARFKLAATPAAATQPEEASLKIHFDIPDAEAEGEFHLSSVLGNYNPIKVPNGSEVTASGFPPGVYDFFREKLVRIGEMGRGVPLNRQTLTLEAGKTAIVEVVRQDGESLEGELIGEPQAKLLGAFILVKPPEAEGLSRFDVMKLPTFEMVGSSLDGTWKTEIIPRGDYLVMAEAYELESPESRVTTGIRWPTYTGTAKVTVPKEGKPPRVRINMKSATTQPTATQPAASSQTMPAELSAYRQREKQLKDELQTLLDKKQSFIANELGATPGVTTGIDIVGETLRSLAAEVTRLEQEKLQTKAVYDNLVGVDPSQIAISPQMMDMIKNDPQIMGLEQQMSSLEQQRQIAIKQDGANHRSVQDIVSQIEALDQQLQELREKKGKEVREYQVNSARTNFLNSMQAEMALRDRMLEAEARQRDLDQSMAKFKALEDKQQQLTQELNEHRVSPLRPIQPGDRLSIRALDFLKQDVESNLNQTVDEHGNIYLPKVGKIEVGGLSTSALRDRIIRVATEQGIYLPDANPSVFVDFSQEQPSQKPKNADSPPQSAPAEGSNTTPVPPDVYFVLGSLVRPGVYSMSGQTMTVRRAIAAAGGLQPASANKKRTCQILRREGDGKERTIPIGDIDAFLSGDQLDVEMQAQDVLRVQ